MNKTGRIADDNARDQARRIHAHQILTIPPLSHEQRVTCRSLRADIGCDMEVETSSKEFCAHFSSLQTNALQTISLQLVLVKENLPHDANIQVRMWAAMNFLPNQICDNKIWARHSQVCQSWISVGVDHQTSKSHARGPKWNLGGLWISMQSIDPGRDGPHCEQIKHQDIDSGSQRKQIKYEGRKGERLSVATPGGRGVVCWYDARILGPKAFLASSFRNVKFKQLPKTLQSFDNMLLKMI